MTPGNHRTSASTQVLATLAQVWWQVAGRGHVRLSRIPPRPALCSTFASVARPTLVAVAACALLAVASLPSRTQAAPAGPPRPTPASSSAQHGRGPVSRGRSRGPSCSGRMGWESGTTSRGGRGRSIESSTARAARCGGLTGIYLERVRSAGWSVAPRPASRWSRANRSTSPTGSARPWGLRYCSSHRQRNYLQIHPDGGGCDKRGSSVRFSACRINHNGAKLALSP
jgi:hypothetical protein